jgi:hypothetical protein
MGLARGTQTTRVPCARTLPTTDVQTKGMTYHIPSIATPSTDAATTTCSRRVYSVQRTCSSTRRTADVKMAEAVTYAATVLPGNTWSTGTKRSDSLTDRAGRKVAPLAALLAGRAATHGPGLVLDLDLALDLARDLDLDAEVDVENSTAVNFVVDVDNSTDVDSVKTVNIVTASYSATAVDTFTATDSVTAVDGAMVYQMSEVR